MGALGNLIVVVGGFGLLLVGFADQPIVFPSWLLKAAGVGAGVGAGVYFLFLVLAVTPFRMWREEKHKNTRLQESGDAQLEVLNLHQLPNDGSRRWYLVVKNKSKTEPLDGCMARIEEFLDANDQPIAGKIVLRTENQGAAGRPQGKFNLAMDQDKNVLLCEPVGNATFSFRILGADSIAQKVQRGLYKLRVRVTGPRGRPVDAFVTISNDKITLDRVE